MRKWERRSEEDWDAIEKSELEENTVSMEVAKMKMGGVGCDVAA